MHKPMITSNCSLRAKSINIAIIFSRKKNLTINRFESFRLNIRQGTEKSLVQTMASSTRFKHRVIAKGTPKHFRVEFSRENLKKTLKTMCNPKVMKPFTSTSGAMKWTGNLLHYKCRHTDI